MTQWKNGTYQTPHLRIQLTNKHIYAKDQWVIHVREFGWDTKYLNIPNESSEEAAQKAAINLVATHLRTMLATLDNQK